VEIFNLFGDDWDDEWGPEGFHRRTTAIGERLGAKGIGAGLYELPPGERTWPYHYEYGNEEWLLCLAGRPTLRTPDGERELEPGEIVAFPEGPGGAHAVSNRAGEPARLVIFSTRNAPGVVVYPDSDKLAVWPGNADDRMMARRAANVDYWHGES
jgi:uncharacterized cupin superfamily protein